MVRHLTERQDTDRVFPGRSAEYREMHQMVADAVEKDNPFPSPLVTMIQNTFDYDPFSAFHTSKVKDTAISGYKT